MGRRDFNVREIVEIYLHWQAGQSIRAISRSLGLDRNTVRKYLKAAREAGFGPDRPCSEDEWVAFIAAVFPQVTGDPLARSAAFVEINQFQEYIREQLEENTVTTVWQRLRDEAGLRASLTSFRRYVRAMLPDVVRKCESTIWRPEVSPGEEAQVDFGYLGTLLDLVTQLKRRVWAFVMVLAYSRHMFVRPVLRMNLETWLECHVEAFEFFGGTPRRLVLDNLKNAVLKPDIYDPKFNRAYAELAAYYQTLIDPCRRGHPKDQPRVERVMPYIRDSFWRGRHFGNLEEARKAAVRWCLETAGTRIHGTTRQRPLELFQQEEKPLLLTLPIQPWELVTWGRARVRRDNHATVAGSVYSVPYKYIGETLEVRIGKNTVQFFRGEELVKTHRRVARGQRQTDPTDLPPGKAAFYERNPKWCLEQAAALGPQVHRLMQELFSVTTLYNLRQAQAILRLGERYGSTRLNAAAARALAYGDSRYRTVKNILEKGLDRIAPDLAESRDVPAFLHGPKQFNHLEV